MSHDEMKKKGNECIRQKNYEDAALHYTSALLKYPQSHTIYSNRSLAYCKLKRFDAALEDANKCIELAPNFARGYLRKSVSLTELREYEKALTAAERGYKLRGSEVICHNCVDQWLEANECLHREKIDSCLQEIGLPKDVIPRGCTIISDDYLTIFLNVLLCRLQFTTTGVEVDFISSCVRKLLQELHHILQRFGHSASPCSKEWLTAFTLASKADPSTSRVPDIVATTLMEKSTKFSTWFDAEVDHALYPIVSPIMCLAIIAINARCISLNVLSSEQAVTLVSCQACLPFFEKSVLSGSAYLLQHISIYKELLESFGTSNYVFTELEVKFGRESIEKLEMLLKLCPVDDYSKDVHDKAMVSIALAKIRLGENLEFDPVQYAAKSGKAVSKVGLMDHEQLKIYAEKKLKQLKNDLDSVMMEFSYEDVEDLLCCTGTLQKIGEKEMVIDAYKVAESIYLSLFQQRITNSTFSLDEAGMFFHTPQTMMLQNICSFLATDNKMVANIVVRWKCIYSEFRATLVRLGIGKRYIETFRAIQQMKVDAVLDQDTLMHLNKQHQKDANGFVEERGQYVLTCLLKQSYEQVQSILQSNQLVLEYCIEREGETDIADSTQTGVLVVIQPNEGPLVFPVDFKKVLRLGSEWSKLLSCPQSQAEAEVVAKRLCELMLPYNIKTLLDSPKVKNVFMCPDMSLSVLPLELLLFEDGEILGDKCTISYLSSSRELLRDLVMVSVATAYEMVNKSDTVKEQSEEATHSIDTQSKDGQQDGSCDKILVSQLDTSSPTYIESAIASLDNQSQNSQGNASQEQTCKTCFIVAAPNYDLEKPTSEAKSTLWESVLQGFASLFSEPVVNTTLAERLVGAEVEAMEVRHVIMKSANPIKVVDITKDNATMMTILQIVSPFILHFSTHGFSYPYPRGCRSSFWDDTLSGVLLAGSNTYRRGNMSKVVPEAGTGELTSLAACGMNLQGTRLVYLSTCVSSYGLYSYGETINSLAQAFRSAGAKTVIATLWPVVDDTAQHFAAYFYKAAFKIGICPSEALVYAKQRIREETTYKHWIYWGGFVCIGEDRPLFPQSNR